MPTIARKGRLMPASPIRKLTPYADKAKADGKIVYHLNIGQPDIHTPEGMLAAIKKADFKVWAYTPSEGVLSYRTKLAAYYRKYGMPVDPEDIIVTCGGSEAILFALEACIQPGEELIIPEPFYANYFSFSHVAGVKVKPVVSRIENGFALPPVADFEKLIGPETRGIFICNPNNPTGYFYSREEFEQLRELALKHDLFIFCDEAYREFCYDGHQFLSPLQLEGLEEHVIVIDTVSKRYSACGARLGALVTKNKSVLETVLKFAQARLSPPAIAQLAAEAALDTPQSYFDEVLGEYTARRNLMVSALQQMEGVQCTLPGGAFYVVVQLPVDNAEKFCQWILEKFSWENQTVMMAPASGFYSTPGSGIDQVRLAYVLNQADLAKAMTCLEKALLAYPGRTVRKGKI
ncbi:MAG: pyridoxal phosphate-dependent aminotransferase [Solitalea sp.]